MEHQQKVLLSHKRFKLLACGRRWGKTALGLIAVLVGHGAHRGQYRGALNGGKIWWVAPSYPIASEVWRDLKRAVRDVAIRMNEVERRVDLPGGGSVMVKSADNPDSLRGAGLDGVVCDEAAFFDADVWERVIPPTIADRRGWVMLFSTPNGFNWFHDLYQFACGDSEWDVFQRPTADNPIIGRDELDRLKRSMPLAAWMQEHEANFISVAGAAFPAEYFGEHIWVDAMPHEIAAGVVALDPAKGVGIKRGDFSAAVYTGFHGGLVYVDAIIERVPPTVATNNALGLAFRHRAKLIVCEGNGFQEDTFRPLFASQLSGNRVHGISVHFPVNHSAKGDAIRPGRIHSLDPYFANNAIRFVRSPGTKILVQQLQEFPMAAHDDGPDALEMAIGHCLSQLQTNHNPQHEAAAILRQRGFV